MKTNQKIINLLIADDHEILRQGVASVISRYSHIKLVAEASNGLEAVSLTDLHQPNVIIMDIEMPQMRGAEATAIITKRYPGIGILAFSMNNADKYIIEMLEAGAKGYLVKNASRHEIIEGIETVADQSPFFCSNISGRVLKMIAGRSFGKSQPNQIEFPPNELQVIDLICRQYITDEISQVLHRSPRTVEGYRETILKKINARNAIGIVLYAIANNMFDPENFKYNSEEH